MAGENNKVVIVTGGSSGIGRCTASALKENGCIVYEFSRRNIPMEGVTHLSVDVTDEDAVNAAVQQVIQKETKIDAVINCAGFGISGAVEFTSMEQAKAQFDVNFFGTVTVNKAVLPFLRHQGKGHIVNISSVAAVAHIPFQTFYSASKAAISSYSYALANEVKPYGIHVTNMKIDAMNTWTIAADAKAGTAQNSIRSAPTAHSRTPVPQRRGQASIFPRMQPSTWATRALPAARTKSSSRQAETSPASRAISST